MRRDIFLQILRFLLASLFLLFWSHSPFAYEAAQLKKNNIAIFYPESKEPYKSIYEDIIAGSRSEAALDELSISQIKLFQLERNFDSLKIIDLLNDERITKVIVLGRLGYKLAKSLPNKFTVISGALPISPNGVSGISLISDPDNLFNYLTQVAPDVKKVHIAYSKKSTWVINLAIIAAKEYGLSLNLKEVTDTKEAVEFYQQLFDSDISKTDAIWVPVDRISSHDKITLPIILEKAWARDVVVFSSKPSHAKRGALFSTYPDNHALGQRLLQMVNDISTNPNEKRFSALNSLMLAVNLRTAAHLGLKYSDEQQQAFELTFPE